MCSRLEIGTSTLAVWEETHADFREALDIARIHAQAHWEDQGHDNIKNRDFNTPIWSRSMAARFPDDWRETSRQEQTGPGGGPIQVTKVERVIVDTNNQDT